VKKRYGLLSLLVISIIIFPTFRHNIYKLAGKAIRNPEVLTKPCKVHIDNVEWNYVDYDGQDFYAAVITPTSCGRLGLNPKAAWHEFLEKVPPNDLWDNITSTDPVYRSMQNQFVCHWVNPEAQLNRQNYRIEPNRKELNILSTYLEGCNTNQLINK
jgi:hypothetical protein